MKYSRENSKSLMLDSLRDTGVFRDWKSSARLFTYMREIERNQTGTVFAARLHCSKESIDPIGKGLLDPRLRERVSRKT